MSTLDFVTSLHALADHIEKHELNDRDVLSARVDKFDGVDVNVAGQDACRRWLAALSNVSADAHVYSAERIHVEATGFAGDMRVKVVCVIAADRETEVYAALLALVPHLEPGQTGPIELPDVLTGPAEAGDQ